MQLDQIIIETRPRSGWSAIDLGCRFALRHYFSCVFLWAVVCSPFLLIAYFQPFPFWVSYLFLWWMKPLMERPILYLFSRELFNQKTSVSDTLRNAKAWLNPGWLSDITFRRIGFSRSFYMSLTVLEGLKGKAHSRRADVLSASGVSSQSSWLTITLYHIEQIFYVALLLSIELLLADSFELLNTLANDGSLLTLIIMLIAFALVAPFYIASGFMLYISRRVELEGWDIELKFRDWMEKHEH